MITPWFELEDKVLNSHHIAVYLIELAKNRGVDVNRLLRGTGIFYQDLENPQFLIASHQLFKLMANLEKQQQTNDVSFLAGRRFFPGNLGTVAQLLMQSTNLNNMLRYIQCYQQQLFPLVHFRVEKHQQHSYLLFSPSVADNEQYKFLLEFVTAAINSSCKWRVGKTVPLHFYFSYSRPRNIYQYEENLGSRIKFEQHLDMIQIENQWLNTDLTDTSRLLQKQYRSTCQQQRRTEPAQTGMIQYISQFVDANLGANLDNLSAHMGLSPATLKRKLKLHGTSFQKIHDQVRCQRAVFDLHVRGETNQNTATKLQFNDLPNFRRSLKRWTGLRPSDLRQA